MKIKTNEAWTDPGLPGLYECHIIYRVGKKKNLFYKVIIGTAVNFKKAFINAKTEIEIQERQQIKVVDNLLNLITDPEEYITT